MTKGGWRVRRRSWKLNICGMALVIGMSMMAGAASMAVDKHRFDIRRGDSLETLQEFQKQSGLLMSYSGTLHITTHRIHGSYVPEVALAKMLRGTGYKGTFLPGGKVAIEPLGATDNTKPVVGPTPTPVVTEQAAREPITEVTVRTGTWIRQGEPVGADLITRTRADIEHSGATTAAEFMEQQTQNFGGGPSQDTRNDSPEGSSDSGLGSGVNLRGLGARATLVLINGRRVAPSGDTGSFVDVENIPMGAIGHVDILPDGGSATYGTDAVGGVVDFVLRDRLSGVELQAERGVETEGGQGYWRLSPMGGFDWDSGHAFALVEWYRRDALPARDRSFMNPDLTREGGVDLDTLSSAPPTLYFGQNNYAVPPGINGAVDLATLRAGTANLSNQHIGADITPYQNRLSVDVAVRQKWGDGIATSLDFLQTDRDAYEWQGADRTAVQIPDDSPLLVNRPAKAGPITLLYDYSGLLGDVLGIAHVKTFNLAVGADISLSDRWDLSASVADVWETGHEYTLNSVNPAEAATQLGVGAFNPFVQGGIVADSQVTSDLRGYQTFGSRSEIHTLSAILNGTFGRVDDVSFHTATGIELRDQVFHTSLSPPETLLSLRRRLGAVFEELVVPLLGSRESDYGWRDLSLSFAGRLEYYNDFGRAAVPRIGLTWRPLKVLKVLGTWGREIRAPDLGDLYEANNASFITTLPDPRSPTGSSKVLIVSGQYAGLSPERAITRTAGFHFDLPARGLSTYLHAKYFSIVLDRVIQSTPFSESLLTDPDLAGVVNRNPSAGVRSSVCGNPNNHYPGTVADCISEPIAALIDLRSLNLGIVRTDGVDVSGGLSLDALGGKFTADIGGTYILHFTQVAMPLAPQLTELNRIGEPVALRVNSAFRWQWPIAGVGIGVNHTGSYRDMESVPIRNVSAFTTVDLQICIPLSTNPEACRDGSRLVLTIRNVFDRYPPFAIDRLLSAGYDPENADPYGRMVILGVTQKL